MAGQSGGKLGQDPAQVRRLGSLLDSGADDVEQITRQVTQTFQRVTWHGADAQRLRDEWAHRTRSTMASVANALRDAGETARRNADEQDTASGVGGSQGGGADGSALDRIGTWLRNYEARPSDGFFGDLLGGPQAGLWGNAGWNTLSTGLDVWGLFPGTVATVVGLPFDLASAGAGYYDAAQAFQDGELFGTIDGLVTAQINLADAAFGVVSLVPHPAVMAVGEAGGIVTGALDTAWSGASVLAQLDAMQGGEHGGSTSRFLLDAVGVDAGLLDGAESFYADASSWVRDQVPVIDPVIDGAQNLVENLVPREAQESIESWASGASDWVDDHVPWWH